MTKEDMEYQVKKLIAWVDRGGKADDWLESKLFTPEESEEILTRSEVDYAGF